MNWKQFLTEKALKECWHDINPPSISNFWYICSCGEVFGDPLQAIQHQNNAKNRTFDNRNDLMDLYQKIYEDGKWDDFFWDFAFKRKPENYGLGEAETSVWLFCLDGKDYEARCKMVAEFYGWKGEK